MRRGGRPPLHLGYPVSDAVGGLFGAVGVLAALHNLAQDPEKRGQEIDCSATEAMLRTLEFLAIEYDQLGAVRTRSGNRSQYAAPGNVYRTADGKWASIAASTQSIFDRLCTALDCGRCSSTRVTPPILRACGTTRHSTRSSARRSAGTPWPSLGDTLTKHEVGFSPIYDIADVFADPQFAARQAIVEVPD